MVFEFDFLSFTLQFAIEWSKEHNVVSDPILIN